MLILNEAQSRALSNFLFDISKGLILGSVGSAVAVSLKVGFVLAVISTFFSYQCVKMGLNLLKDIQ